MRKKRLISFLLLSIFIMILSSNVSTAENTEYPHVYVGGSGEGNYSSIQEAVNHAHSPTEILVYPGIYNESIDLYKPMILKSVIPHQAKIWFQGKDDVVEISADGCRLEGFNISHLTGKGYTSVTVTSNRNIIKNNIFYENPGRGLYFFNCDHNYVEQNHFFSDGIHIVGRKSQWSTHTFSNNTVEGKKVLFLKNTTVKKINNKSFGQIILANCSQISFNNCTVGNGDQGFLVGHCNFCDIQNNIVFNNTYGIHLSYTDNCTITSNTLTENQYGIYVIHANKNIVNSNNINHQTRFGIWICCNSKDNLLYSNSFIDNNQSAYDLFSNKWHFEHHGNYWSDYTGLDKNNDAIGDVPYSILGDTAVDPYPLMNSSYNNNNQNGKSNQTPFGSFELFLLCLVSLIILRRIRRRLKFN